MSWGFVCAKCKNEDQMLFVFIDHESYTPVKNLDCMVCSAKLKHIDYGWTELRTEYEETKEVKE